MKAIVRPRNTSSERSRPGLAAVRDGLAVVESGLIVVIGYRASQPLVEIQMKGARIG